MTSGPRTTPPTAPQKVWAAKFAARHPNVVVVDFSSFKCGHDAPTYGMIDSIISAGATPYSALHDIDANKPSGSIKIRVRTYGYTLERHAEELARLSQRRSELQRLVDTRREELLAARRLALANARAARSPCRAGAPRDGRHLRRLSRQRTRVAPRAGRAEARPRMRNRDVPSGCGADPVDAAAAQ